MLSTTLPFGQYTILCPFVSDQDTPVGTKVALVVDGRLAATGRLVAARRWELHGVHVKTNGIARAVIEVQSIQIPNAPTKLHLHDIPGAKQSRGRARLHYARTLASFGSPLFRILCQFEELRHMSEVEGPGVGDDKKGIRLESNQRRI